IISFFVYHRDLHSFPTRRSSDLLGPAKIYVDDELKVETGADGKFKISVKPGSYKVKAAYGERTSAVETVNVDREDVKVVLKIERSEERRVGKECRERW